MNNIKMDINTIATLERLVESYPDLAVDFGDLPDNIDKCGSYSDIATLIDAWLDENPEIEQKFNAILNDSENVAKSRFFQDINNSKQDPETLNKEKITLLTNKLRDRSQSPNKNNSGSSDS